MIVEGAEAGHVSPSGVLLGALAGAVLALAIPGLLLLGEREPSVSPAHVRPLTEGLRDLGGAPRFPEDPGSIMLLLQHPDGAPAAVARMRANAEDTGWRVLGGSVISPEGVCASFHTLDGFLAEDRDADLERAVRTAARGQEGVAVLVATPRC